MKISSTRHSVSIICAAFILLIAVFTLSAQGKEVKIKKSKIPAAVVSTFTKAYPNAKIKGASKETENGTTYYEIESVDGKIHRDVLYSADGVMHETEETIEASALPDNAQKMLSKEYPKGKIVKAEKLSGDHESGFEVQLKVDGKVKEVSFDEQGNRKNAEKKEVKAKKAGKGTQDEKDEKDEKDED